MRIKCVNLWKTLSVWRWSWRHLCSAGKTMCWPINKASDQTEALVWRNSRAFKQDCNLYLTEGKSEGGFNILRYMRGGSCPSTSECDFTLKYTLDSCFLHFFSSNRSDRAEWPSCSLRRCGSRDPSVQPLYVKALKAGEKRMGEEKWRGQVNSPQETQF